MATHFAAFVYENAASTSNNPIYDVNVMSGQVTPIPDKFRKLVAEKRISTHKSITLSTVTQYMYWKFPVKQTNIIRPTVYGANVMVRSCRQKGEFTQIAAQLEWITSIIRIEFDYHIGENQYVKVMEDYRRIAEVGFLDV